MGIPGIDGGKTEPNSAGKQQRSRVHPDPLSFGEGSCRSDVGDMNPQRNLGSALFIRLRYRASRPFHSLVLITGLGFVCLVIGAASPLH